jgi:hypothetical protein
VAQEFDWDGKLLWEFRYADDNVRMHHDIALLPNGNVLMIARERKSNAEAIAAGRNPEFLGEIWPDHVIEVEPVGTNDGNIVWAWHVWDHLVQDVDPAKANFGVVADHPERVDINFGVTTSADWTHGNSIDYNEDFDQIILSVKNFAEAWVIDHSTTTAEAAGHTGGNSGKGGGLLYRWGNPQAYGRGTPAEQKFWGQHDAQWIREGRPGAGNILLFNNGPGRPTGSFSTIDEFAPPVDGNGFYTNPPPGVAFAPVTQSWVYTATPPNSLYSAFISGADRLPNGNTLICEALSGDLQEVTANGDLVWRYINPVNSLGPKSQGTRPSNNITVRADRYPPDYPAFAGRDLTPNGTVELDGSAPFALRQAGRTEFNVTLTWGSLPDVTYHIQHTLSLVNPAWSTISTHIAIGTLTHFTDTDPVRINQDRSCYRAIAPP